MQEQYTDPESAHLIKLADTAPTKPGWYWVKHEGEWEVVQAVRNRFGTVVVKFIAEYDEVGGGCPVDVDGIEEWGKEVKR